MSDDIINLYIVSIKDVNDKLFKYGLKLISEDRRKKVNYYKNRDDQIRCLISSLLIDKFTSKSTLRYSKEGKPYKKGGVQFNISHSSDYVVISLCKYKIGVDIEIIKDYEKELINFSSSLNELKNIKSSKDFTYYWTKKEAYVKYLGTGFKKKPNKYDVDLLKNKVNFISLDYKEDYVISICSKCCTRAVLNELKFVDLL